MKKSMLLGTPVIILSLLIFLLPCLNYGCTSDSVVFPDWNLEQTIRDNLHKASGALTEADLGRITSLDASFKKITDWTGLEKFSSLVELHAGGNKAGGNLYTLLKPLKQLRKLDLSSYPGDKSVFNTWTRHSTVIMPGLGPIADVAPLAALTQLTSLDIGWNQVSDISPLSALNALTELNLYATRITDISPLSTLTNLYDLNLLMNEIKDFTPLVSLKKLTRLCIDTDEKTDISFLSSLTGLSTLWLGTAKDPAVLASLKNLQELRFYESSGGYTTLSQLAGLERLSINIRGVTDLAPLAGLVNLHELILNGGDMDAAVPELTFLTAFKELTVFEISQVPGIDLSPVTALTDLEELYLNTGRISEITFLAPLKTLKILDLSGNDIKDISLLLYLPKLKSVSLYGNPLDEISVNEYIPKLEAKGVEVFWSSE